MPRHGNNVELDEMLRRLSKLEGTFPDNGNKVASSQVNQAFEDLEKSFLRQIEKVQVLVKSFNDTTSADVTSVLEKIRQKRNIHNELQAISEIMKRLKALIEKETRKKNKKVSDEEMLRRETNFQSFEHLLGKVQSSLRKARLGDVDGISRTALTKEDLFGSARSGSAAGISGIASRGAGIGMETGASNENRDLGLSIAQQQTMLEIQQRDQEQCLILDEIDSLIEEANKIAEDMQKAIATQKELLDGVEKNIHNTQGNLESVDGKVKKALKSKGLSWERMCIISFCTVILLGLIGIIVSGL